MQEDNSAGKVEGVIPNDEEVTSGRTEEIVTDIRQRITDLEISPLNLNTDTYKNLSELAAILQRLPEGTSAQNVLSVVERHVDKKFETWLNKNHDAQSKPETEQRRLFYSQEANRHLYIALSGAKEEAGEDPLPPYEEMVESSEDE